MLSHLVNGKISRAEDYVFEGTLHINTKDKKAKSFYTSLFASITYIVSGSTITDNTAEVTVSVTMIDMQTLMAYASLDALKDTFGESSNGAIKYYKVITEKIDTGEVLFETNVVTVYMIKDGGKWKVNMTNSSKFADAITGGFKELIGY